MNETLDCFVTHVWCTHSRIVLLINLPYKIYIQNNKKSAVFVLGPYFII